LLGTVRDKVKPPHCIQLVFGHKVWKVSVFCIPKKVLQVEKQIIEERDWRGLFETTWASYRNCHYMLLKMKGKYHFNISAISQKWHLMADTGIPPIIKE